MRKDMPKSRPQTLGDLIVGLRPGSACPWCGCALQPSRSFRAVTSREVDESPEPMDEPVLHCPDCGADICESKTSPVVRRKGPLGAAA